MFAALIPVSAKDLARARRDSDVAAIQTLAQSRDQLWDNISEKLGQAQAHVLESADALVAEVQGAGVVAINGFKDQVYVGYGNTVDEAVAAATVGAFDGDPVTVFTAGTRKRLEEVEGLDKAEADLEKVSLTPDSVASRMRPHQMSEWETVDRVESYKLPNGMFHHVYYQGHPEDSYRSVFHSISNYDNPLYEGMATSASGLHKPDAEFLGGVTNNPWHDQFPVIVHGETASVGPKGTGSILYREMAKVHGRMASDSSVSAGSEKVWDKLLQDPNFVGAKGPEKGARHYLEYKGPKPVPYRVIEGSGRSLKEDVENPDHGYQVQVRKFSLKHPDDYLEAQVTHGGEDVGGIGLHVDPNTKSLYSIGPYHRSRGAPGGSWMKYGHKSAAGIARKQAEAMTGFRYRGDLPTEVADTFLKKSEIEHSVPKTIDPEQAQALFHQLAQTPDPESEPRGEAQRRELVKVLKKIKAQAPVLAQLKEQAPQAYAGVQALIRSVIAMARELKAQPQPQPVQKAETRTPFAGAAFKAGDGTVFNTGSYHDIYEIPESYRDQELVEGFLGHDGTFYDRAQAATLVDKVGDESNRLDSADPEAGLWKAARDFNYNTMSLVSPEGKQYPTQGMSHPDWAHANRHLVGFEPRDLDDEEGSYLDAEGSTALDHFLDQGWIRVKPNQGVELRGLYPENVHHVKNILKDIAASNPGRYLYVDTGDGSKHIPVSESGRPSFKELSKWVQKGEWEDKLPGGKADAKKPSDFDPAQVRAGTEHEYEHTQDPHLAEEIALDHLHEDEKYYTHLQDMEEKVDKALGDWTKDPGYKISHEPLSDSDLGKDVRVTVTHNGNVVGTLDAGHSQSRPGTLYPIMVNVDPAHKRKGLGTAMYVHAEKVLGAPFSRGSYQTPEAKALWAQKKRPFGLDKAAIPTTPSARHHQILPVGSMLQPGPQSTRSGSGYIKVKPEDKAKWRSVRSGLVMARDGSPISAKNPEGK